MLRYEDLPAINSERWLSLDDLEGEVWRDVPGYESLLQVSNYSRVLNKKRKKIVKQTLRRDGYYVFGIKVNNKVRLLPVHRLEVMAFLPNPDNKRCVDHIDTNKKNNTISNLRWVSHKENANNPLTKLHRRESHKHTVFGAKRVAKYDMLDNIIKIYNSITEAAKENGLSIGVISNVVRKAIVIRKHGTYQYKEAGGYKWQYI